jgi:hypothetical protein
MKNPKTKKSADVSELLWEGGACGVKKGDQRKSFHNLEFFHAEKCKNFSSGGKRERKNHLNPLNLHFFITIPFLCCSRIISKPLNFFTHFFTLKFISRTDEMPFSNNLQPKEQ